MGVVTLAGIALSNSILTVEFAHRLLKEGHGCSRGDYHILPSPSAPILMTSLATVIGLPMDLRFGEGSESYALLAQALIGGFTLSAPLTIFLVSADFYLAYRNNPQLPGMSSGSFLGGLVNSTIAAAELLAAGLES